MPWKDTRPVDQRLKFIEARLSGEYSMVTLCRMFGISTKTGYKWWHRFEQEGMPGLLDRSRASHSHLYIGLTLDVKTRRWCPVVVPSTDVRFQMGTVGQGGRKEQGGRRPEARGESGGTSPSSKRVDGLRGRRAAGAFQGPGGGSLSAKRSRTMRFSRLVLADFTSTCSFCCCRLRISVSAPLRSLFSTIEPWVTQPSL